MRKEGKIKIGGKKEKVKYRKERVERKTSKEEKQGKIKRKNEKPERIKVEAAARNMKNSKEVEEKKSKN